MALKRISSTTFINGILVDAVWEPSAPRVFLTGRSSSKNRYVVYPTIKNDIDGTGTFVEVTSSWTTQRMAITESAAKILQDGVESVAFTEDKNRSTTGRMIEQDRIIGAWIHEITVEKKETKMVEWVEGQIEAGPE